jgi:site-specific recombinase XerD
MQNKVSVLFYIKRTKISANGQTPIYMRVTVGGKRIDKSTGESVEEKRWIANAGKTKASNEECKRINDYLDVLKTQVYDYRTQFIREGIPVNYDNIKNKIFGIEERPLSLVEIFRDHNKRFKALVGKEFAAATLQRYETTLKHTQQFLKWKYNKSDIDIRNIDFGFITEFEFFLRSERNCANNSAVKYLKNFGKIIKICLNNHWISRDPFANYKSKLVEVDTVFLTDDELQTIIDKKFFTTRLTRVRDAFIFSCFTGLAYIDAKKVEDSNVIKGIDGGNWLSIMRQKTKIKCNIPILPQAQYVIDKYANDPETLNTGRLLFTLSNQKMNEYLKEIMDVCGIEKKVTYHSARHTFATTVTLAKGVPIETVSKMMGHKTLKMTMHYAKIIDSKVSVDMQQVRAYFKLSQIQSQLVISNENTLIPQMIIQPQIPVKIASNF